MLRAALALLSTLQVGARIRKSFERSLRQAIVIAIAAVLLLAAAVFALVAAYHALVSIYHFDPVEAAAIIAAGLLLVGLIVLAMVPLVGRQPERMRPVSLHLDRQCHRHDRSARRQRHEANRPGAASRHCLHRRHSGRPQVA